MSHKLDQPDRSDPGVSLLARLRVAVGLLLGLRRPDFQAAAVFVRTQYAGRSFLGRWARFLGWTLCQSFGAIPAAMQHLSIDRQVSRTPMWLLDGNPLADHPWKRDSHARLPHEVDTVVIGAGFSGAALAHHWARRAPWERQLVVLEMHDPASGSSGRNEGLVVMGRYCTMVHDSVLKNLRVVRPDLSAGQQTRLATRFATCYCQAAYRNAAMIERTIREEGFDCDYVRAGWVQARATTEQKDLAASVEMALKTGCTDWTSITPAEALESSGMRLSDNAGYSVAAASWHPAKWVWCLLSTALAGKNVELFTRTRVLRVEDAETHYRIHTDRGPVDARNVVHATESYTPHLLREFHDIILPLQEQAASGDGGPESMRPNIGISGRWFFAGRYGRRTLFGSGGSRVRDDEAGRNRPSRFLTKFVASELLSYFGPYRLHMTHEWSGTVGYTPDEYPIVGSIDGRGQHIIAGMCGSGSAVSFNGGRCIVNRILGHVDEPDDYPAAYFAPSRLLRPAEHPWPACDGSDL